MNSALRDLTSTVLSEPGVAMLIGGTDTGKSFLAHRLAAEAVRAGRRCALVDGDMGQACFGPPATARLLLFTHSVPARLDRLRPDRIRFIGSTSPAGFLVQTLTAVKSLVETALSLAADTVIVDTTGFIEGETAREFKYQKICLINPRHLVALARGDELDPIVNPFAARPGMTIHRLAPDPAARVKSRAAREENRAKMFRRYFREGAVKEVRLKDFCLQGRIPAFSGEDLEGLLIAFCDAFQNAVPGVIRSCSAGRATMKVLTPLRSLKKMVIIRFGAVKLPFIGHER